MQRNLIDVRKGRPTMAGGVLFAVLGLTPVTLPAAQVPTEQVRITDLDLATPAGQQVFERRLKAAVDRVCVRPNSQLPQTRKVQQGIQRCQVTARADARKQLLAHGIAFPALRLARRD